MRQKTLVIMLKDPKPGRVKTRLGRDIGHVQAARWFRRHALDLIRRLRDPRWQIVLAVSPDRDGLQSRVWPQDLARVPQGLGDLGDRMGRMLRSMPPGPVCVIGADIPALGRTQITNAFAALGRADAVIGPAEDGGYWLIGMARTRAVSPHIFRSVRWSTAYAMADTVASLPDVRIAYLETLADVDNAADLARAKPSQLT